MKAILFTQEDTAEFNALQERIHLYLESIVDYKYSASCWADVESVYIYDNKLCMPIAEEQPRYNYILEVLTQEEIDSIQDINLE